VLLNVLKQRDDLRVFIDTWENEPNLLRDLLQRVDLATPHIAGYSVEGRLRGTQMVLDAASAHFKRPAGWHMTQQLPQDQDLILQASDPTASAWLELFHQHFNIWRDHDAFTAGSNLDTKSFVQHFDALRRVYPDRLEYGRFIVQHQNTGLPARDLQQLGFQTAI